MRYAHNKWTKQPFPSSASVAGGGFALIVLVLAWLVLTETPERVRAPEFGMAQVTAARSGAVAPIAAYRPTRLVYRHSVLPGGVHGAAELAFALSSDPVASAHFAGFDVAAARIVRVEKSRLVHVSYRIGDKIYWTKHKVRLAVGEELLSDGTHLVRARCGNRIADAPQGIILDNEPAPEMLDALMVSADGLLDESTYVPSAASAISPEALAQAVGQRQQVRLASNVQFGTPSPSASSRDTSPRLTLAQAPPVSVSMPGLTPSAAPRPGGAVAARPAPGQPAQFPVGPLIGVPSPPAAPVSAVPVPDVPAPPPPGPTAGPQPLPPAAPKPATPDSPAPFPPGPTFGPQPAAPTAPTQIPEPGSAALAAIALVAVALARRGRNRRAARTEAP
ncbi:MAG: hypothetical protein V4693_09965 [Pseudomonadota bacterium]